MWYRRFRLCRQHIPVMRQEWTCHAMKEWDVLYGTFSTHQLILRKMWKQMIWKLLMMMILATYLSFLSLLVQWFKFIMAMLKSIHSYGITHNLTCGSVDILGRPQKFSCPHTPQHLLLISLSTHRATESRVESTRLTEAPTSELVLVVISWDPLTPYGVSNVNNQKNLKNPISHR